MNELLTKNSRVTEIKIEALDATLMLRPLPIAISRDIAQSLKSMTDLINKIGRQTASVQRELDRLGDEYRSGALTTGDFLTKTSELTDKLSESMPEDLDWKTAEAVLRAFSTLLAYYDHNIPMSQLESKITMSEMVDVLEEQLKLNSENDFLLGPLRVILTIIKRIPQQMAATVSTMESLKS